MYLTNSLNLWVYFVKGVFVDAYEAIYRISHAIHIYNYTRITKNL